MPKAVTRAGNRRGARYRGIERPTKRNEDGDNNSGNFACHGDFDHFLQNNRSFFSLIATLKQLGIGIQHNEEFLMRHTLKLTILFLCLVLIAGIFMGTFAGAADTTMQPQCLSSADTVASAGTSHAICMSECLNLHCSHPPDGFGWLCEFGCWTRCPLW